MTSERGARGLRIFVRFPDVAIDDPSAAVAQANADLARLGPLATGAFTHAGRSVEYAIELPIEASPAEIATAVEVAKLNEVTFAPHFAHLAPPRPRVPPPPRATASELARVRAAYPPFADTEILDSAPRDSPWPNHRVFDVSQMMPIAVGITVVFGADTVYVLRANPGAVAQIAAIDPPGGLGDLETAKRYALACGAWTTDALYGELPIDSFADIPCTGIEHLAALPIHPLLVETSAGAYIFKMWRVSMSRLIYREIMVPIDGRLSIIDRDYGTIPVPPGVAWGKDPDRVRYIPVR